MNKKYHGVLTGLIIAGGLLLTLWLGMNGGTAAARFLLAPGNPVLSPAANVHDVARNATVSITYDADIDASTVTTRTFAVHAMQTGQLLEGYSVNGGEIKVTPPQPFKPGELVQVSATTGTLGLDASAPLTPTVWQFRVAAMIGSGVFTDSTQSLGTSQTYRVSLGDLDGDGDLDAVTANGDSLSNGVWINDGTGTFSITQTLGNLYSRDIALGDLDGDGDLDVWAANSNNHPDKIWLNDGAAFFSAGQEVGNSDSLTIALGDVDGDGDLDAVVGNKEEPNQVWLNNGGLQGGTPGEFTNTGHSLGGTELSYGVGLGDLDGDGDLDAFVVNYTHSVKYNQVYLNDGTGVFSDTGQTLGDAASLDVALGDLDGDGDLDAFVANKFESNCVWENDGHGQFTDSEQSLGVAPSYGLALGDVDSDGDLDAFVSNYITLGDGTPNTVWLNDGKGIYVDSGQILGSRQSTDVALGDLDGDGDLDAFIANGGEGIPNSVWVNIPYHVYLPLVIR